MKTKNVFAVCSMFVLCACAAGPDYQRPKTPQTEDYTAKNDYLSSETHIALGKELTAEWWTLFSSESINNTIQQALQDNYTLAAAKARLAQAQEAVKSKSGELLPQISLLGVTGAQKYGVAQFGPSNFSVPAYSYYELGPQANWTPDIFGGTRRSIEWQKALANHQAYQLKAAYLTLTSNIVAQVIEIAVTKGKIETVEQMIALDRKQRKLTEASFEAGAATKLDILKAENQLNDDLALLPPLQQNLKLAEHALSVLVGKAPSEWTVPDFTLSDLMLPKELPVSLPSELVHKRPDILAAEANLQAASAAVGVATANLYPSLLITGNTLQESLALHSLFNGANNAWALAANLTAPLFSGGTLSAEKRMAEQAYQEALANYQQSILIGFSAVADALTGLKHDSEAMFAQKRAVHLERDALALARKSYAAGAMNILQVQSVERKVAQAQLALLQMQRQQYLDTAQLFIALGGSPLAKGTHDTVIPQ